MRPGQLCHLLLPDDIDLETGWLYVRNKPKLGWQVKTRNQRDIPLIPVLANVLRHVFAGRTIGPVFRQRRFSQGCEVLLDAPNQAALQSELARRIRRHEATRDVTLTRKEKQEVAITIWRDMGAIENDMCCREFGRHRCHWHG